MFQFGSVALPVSILWFPITFLITDIVSEIYGAKRAYYLVIMGFSMNVVLLIAIMIGMALPTASFYPLSREYNLVFSPTWRLLFASMSAYLLAQTIDVKIFHFWKNKTKGRHLWLRNNGSTLISQFIDTITVSFIFLYNNQSVFTGSISDLWTLVGHLYLIKAVIALLDTPFFYLAVWWLKRLGGESILLSDCAKQEGELRPILPGSNS